MARFSEGSLFQQEIHSVELGICPIAQLSLRLTLISWNFTAVVGS